MEIITKERFEARNKSHLELCCGDRSGPAGTCKARFRSGESSGKAEVRMPYPGSPTPNQNISIPKLNRRYFHSLHPGRYGDRIADC